MKKMRQATEEKKMTGNLPIKKYRSGNIQGAIWFNEKDKGDGVKVGFKTATIRRSWRKEGDVWREEVINLRRQDIPKIMTILHEIQKELYLTDEKGE